MFKIWIRIRVTEYNPTLILSPSGQKFVPSNVHNLGQNSSNWKTDIYDLRSWYDGFCHTLDPKHTQKRALSSKLSIYLGHRDVFDTYDGIMFKQFNVVMKLFFLTDSTHRFHSVHSFKGNILAKK